MRDCLNRPPFTLAASLWPFALPFIPFVVVLTIGETLATHDSSNLVSGAGSPVDHVNADRLLGQRLIYAAFGALQILAAVLVAASSLHTLLTHGGRFTRHAVVAVVIFFALVMSILVLQARDETALARLSYVAVADGMRSIPAALALTADRLGSISYLDLIALTVVGSGVLALGFVLAVLSMVVAPTDDPGSRQWIETFSDRITLFQDCLYLLSALFVTSTLAAMSFFFLLGDLYSGSGSVADALSIRRVADGVSVLWGVTFSMIIVTSVVPTGLVLIGRARELAGSHLEIDSEPKFRSWLRTQGFDVAARIQTLRIVSMLTPAILGASGSDLIGSISGLAPPL